DSRFTGAADLLRAHALARLKDTSKARTILDAVAADETAPPYLHARVAFVRLTAELVERGLPLPADRPTRKFPPAIGRPLVQSLWVGRRLRWIERLAIKSYLDNGWRFQLYVYDDVEDVPSGCEILDAATIIPEGDVFAEGPGSGLHAGSIGAFSDLFRYRLLHERGGMWSDTDVINLRQFDPDGMKFVSTEVTDAGLITLNGAIMAAPAGDPFVARAYERAAALLRTDKMFFTRIGPYLLAELVVEMGVDTVELMPPDFLSPVSWMNTGSLLQPYETVAALPTMRAATNLHVYTEMWRMLELGLDRPPPPETFLGRLYARSFGERMRVEKAATA
ncbi:MAG: glycosyltransferase, partial [Stellaceae bacterium]